MATKPPTRSNPNLESPWNPMGNPYFLMVQPPHFQQHFWMKKRTRLLLVLIAALLQRRDELLDTLSQLGHLAVFFGPNMEWFLGYWATNQPPGCWIFSEKNMELWWFSCFLMFFSEAKWIDRKICDWYNYQRCATNCKNGGLTMEEMIGFTLSLLARGVFTINNRGLARWNNVVLMGFIVGALMGLLGPTILCQRGETK